MRLSLFRRKKRSSSAVSVAPAGKPHASPKPARRAGKTSGRTAVDSCDDVISLGIQPHTPASKEQSQSVFVTGSFSNKKQAPDAGSAQRQGPPGSADNENINNNNSSSSNSSKNERMPKDLVYYHRSMRERSLMDTIQESDSGMEQKQTDTVSVLQCLETRQDDPSSAFLLQQFPNLMSLCLSSQPLSSSSSSSAAVTIRDNDGRE